MKVFWRIVKITVTTVLALVLAAAFYLGVILGQPQQNQQEEVDLHQPLLAASPKRDTQQGDPLSSVINGFPIEILCAPEGSGYTLENASSYDVSFEGDIARVVRLQYLSDSGYMLAVDSVYPARALDVLQYGGYQLIGEGSAVAGLRSVRMENGETVRLHAQSSTGLYVVTAPLSALDQLAILIRPLQLMKDID